MAKKSNFVHVSSKIKSTRMKNVFSQSYDSAYAQKNTKKQINADIQYLRNTLYRSKKAFDKRGLGAETSKYFDTALKSMRLNKDMGVQERTELLNSVVKYTREHRLTVSLFDIQKQLTLEALESDGFSSVVRQSREMSDKKDLSIKDLSDSDLYKVFEALGSIRKGLGKYEKGLSAGSGDEFDAAIEVVYSMNNDNSDWKYNKNIGLSDNILEYLKQSNAKVMEKEFK